MSSTEIRTTWAGPGQEDAGKHSAARDPLRRFGDPVRRAAAAFRETRDIALVPEIVEGVILHYVDPSRRARMRSGADRMRLAEDLGIDSLTLLEIVFLAEEVLCVSIENDEFRPFATVGDVKRLLVDKVSVGPA